MDGAYSAATAHDTLLDLDRIDVGDRSRCLPARTQ